MSLDLAGALGVSPQPLPRSKTNKTNKSNKSNKSNNTNKTNFCAQTNSKK